MTHQVVMEESLAILEELNVFGVTTGPLDLVERWRKESPQRIVPAVSFFLTEEAPSPELLRNWHAEGRIAVFGEVLIQYQGIQPSRR